MCLVFANCSLDQHRTGPDISRFPYRLLDKAYVSLAAWSSGMILASGARGPGFNSRSSPFLFGMISFKGASAKGLRILFRLPLPLGCFWLETRRHHSECVFGAYVHFHLAGKVVVVVVLGVVFPFESMCSFPNAFIYHVSDSYSITQIAHVALLGLWWQVISNASPGSPTVS